MIFDDNRLTQFLLKRRAENARDQIAGAARRKWNDNFDGPIWKTCGVSRKRNRHHEPHETECSTDEAANCNARKHPLYEHHVSLPCASSVPFGQPSALLFSRKTISYRVGKS